MFRQSNIPKRLIPGTIALGAFSFTMDSLPGTPQIQNIIPTTYFKTTAFAAPALGIIGGIFILIVGMSYLEWQRHRAATAGEGYGEGHTNEPPPMEHEKLASAWLAFLPLVLVFGLNKVFTTMIKAGYGASYDLKLPAMAAPVHIAVDKLAAVWAVEGALLAGIISVLVFAWRPVSTRFAEGGKAAVAGALLASINTASEYGFGAVIATLPGFLVIRDALGAIPNPLVREAVTVTSLAGITGSASGGLSIALAAMSKEFIEAANAARHSDGSAAPRRVDGFGRHGHLAAQRRGDHAAHGLRPDPQAVLQGYFRGDRDQDHGGVRRDRDLLRDRAGLRIGAWRPRSPPRFRNAFSPTGRRSSPAAIRR